MPLPERVAAWLREHVTRAMPEREFEVATAMGYTRTVRGYVRDSRGALDALGMPEREARFAITPDQDPVQPGDQLDDQWVVWTPLQQTGAFLAGDLRRLLPFSTWTRERQETSGRDPVTRAPVITTTLASLDGYLLTAEYRGGLDEGTVSDRTTGRLIIRAAPDVLRAGDRVSHEEHGIFDVMATAPYGPWAAARVEAP